MGQSPIVLSGYCMDADIGMSLIRKGANLKAESTCGTALHFAALYGNAKLARGLLREGANVNAVARDILYTPLHMAARNGHMDVIGLLIEAGADCEAINDVDERPADVAAVYGHSAAADLLAVSS